MKQHSILFILLILFGYLKAQERYSFRTDQLQGFSVENSTATGLKLHYSISDIGIATINNGETKGHEIVLKGSFGSFAEGLPNLPFENRYIAVPRGAKVSIKIKENGRKLLQDIDLLPAAPLQMNGEDKRPELHWDMNVFSKDANFPTENVTIAQTTQIRGLDVVMLSVTPFRYNPVKKTLEVIYDMDIDIRFEGGNGRFGEERYLNPEWDNILHDLVINSDMLSESHYYERLNEAIRNKEEGCEYLIITPDDPDFQAWADTLKRFRSRQGILTKVVTTTDCGSNEAEDIRNYILNAYENWAIPPAAVLLFGGNHVTNPSIGLKPYIFTSPVSWGETYRYPTDNPFADMNGDSIPDLAVSRMTVLNANDCQQQVEKLIDFELSPPTDPHYYDHPVINSGYQDTKWFAITAQVTNNFFRVKLDKHPANIYMKYWYEDQDPTPPDSIWSIANNTDAVLDYFGPNGAQYLPQSIEYLNDWIDMQDKVPFQNAVNEGSFLTFYRDHSNPDWWCCSNINHYDIPFFHNESPTFLYSIGCSTNSFWNDWSYDGCVSESFIHSEVGAIGSLGPNTVTYSHYNDLTTWGMFDYFWPDYMPTLGSQTEPDFSYPSYALVAGKLFLRQQTFLPYTTDTVKVEKTLNLFSYLGETYLNLHTEVPQPMDVFIPAYQTENQREITFTAEENAMVCISRDDEIIHVARGTGLPMTFGLPVMQANDQYQVTITKKNHIRYQQDVKIIPATGSFMTFESYQIHDENGNNILEFNENVSIDIALYNAGVEMAENSEITLACESPFVEILQGSAVCSSLSSNGHITLSNIFRVKIAHDIPDQTPIVFRIVLDNGHNLQQIEFEQKVAAPALSICPYFRFLKGNLEPSVHILTDTTTYLTSFISNHGHAKSEPIDISMDIKAPFVNVESLNDLFDGLGVGDTLFFNFKINAIPNETKEAWLQTHIDMQSGSCHTLIDTLLPFGGVYETFETDELNPLFSWTNDNNYPWDYCADDAFEGTHCFMTSLPNHKASKLTIVLNEYQIPNNGVMSFYIKDEGSAASLSLIENTASGNITQTYSNTTDWTRIEAPFYANCRTVTFGVRQYNASGSDFKLDNICFPPMRHTIAYAGNNLVLCDNTSVELQNAYAYDCDSVAWHTDGDGRFDCDTLVNPTYFPGERDLALGETILSLYAYGTDTIVSSTRIDFVNEIQLSAINGDSIVNKYEQTISHYSIENQEGINYVWQLEPSNSGNIYSHGNQIEIAWNLQVNNTDVILTVTADNGCDTEPISKHISFIGYGTKEWRNLSFDLFPNPTDGKVNLVMGETLHGKTMIEVYNLFGECMFRKDLSTLHKGTNISLDLRHLVSGLYIIKLSTENGSCIKKVSVK